METPFPTAASDHLLPVLLTSYHSNNPVDYKGRSQAGHSGFCPDSERFVLRKLHWELGLFFPP